MSRNYIGAKRKRTNTPAQNRKRAVEYRHRPYATLKIEREPVSEPELILNEAEEAEEPEVIQETANEPEQPEAASESEETAAEETAEPALTQAAQTFAAAGFFSSRARRRKRGCPGCVRDPRASSRVETGVSGTS